MTQEARFWVFMPAGAQGGESGRPQCVERLDLLDDPRTKAAADLGIGFGLELKGPDKARRLGFCPDLINGLPYTAHMGNEDLSDLFGAEQEGEGEFQDRFWSNVNWLASLDPKPLSVGLHGGRINLPSVTLDEHRYDWRISPGDFLALQDWHGTVVQKILDLGVTPAIEIVGPGQFVGPPLYGEKAVWAPLTYHEARIGAHPQDLCYLRDNYSCEIWVDLEHLFFALNFLNHEANYAWMKDPRSWTRNPEHDEFVRRIGYAAEVGRPPLTRGSMGMHEAIEQMAACHLHVGGSRAEVVDIRQDEPQPPLKYLEAVQEVLEPYPGMFPETVGKRVGSHDSIDRGDVILAQRVKTAITAGAKTFLVETSGYTPTDCWYWARPDAMEFSYFEFLAMLSQLIS